jgi:S-adenosylmethionine:tRNA ribosyltransferase-isomerase
LLPIATLDFILPSVATYHCHIFMKTNDFDFELPDELIARYPLPNRTESRLLSLKQGRIAHHVFKDLTQLLQANDLLILNNTRVIPARLYAKKLTGGKVEILIERIVADNLAYVHIKSNKSLPLPCRVILENGDFVSILECHDSLFKARFHITQSIAHLLTEIGYVPLPNYMQRQQQAVDKERYQTIYAEKDGAVAAPTAGLHFDHSLFNQLHNQGINTAFITLHVGAGTFKPVTARNIADHRMHHERFEINQEVCDLINKTKALGGRIIAVGTTSVRALETVMQKQGHLSPFCGETNIFIYPGFHFRCIDALITNFHIPRSTLLMLVCAFGGVQEVLHAYQRAITMRYRFYSYGDAMLVFKNEV